MNFIYQINYMDIVVLRWINSTAHPALDSLMKVISSPVYGFLIGAGFFVWAITKEVRWGRWLCLVVLAIAIADFAAAEILKPMFNRLRPCKVWDFIRLINGCGGWDSFPSNHATNSAVVFSFLYNRINRIWTGVGGFIVFLICMSRVYLGVHYPSDVIVGALFGFSFGTFFQRINQLFLKL